MAKHTSAQQLYDLLVSRNFDPELLDSSGRPSKNPNETEIFSFDFTTESGNDYGTVVIMLGDDNDMEIYFGDNIGRGMEAEDKKEWFDFLYQLRMFAKRNLMTFGLKNLNRLRYSMQGQAALKEGLFEAWSGKKDVSWNAGPTESRLMIRHKRSLGENEARFRCVESLFIETVEGERYKLPFKNLAGGKAMLEHVRVGGRPYDQRGQHISEMVTELSVLSRFRRANHGRIFEGDTAALVEQTNVYYETARHTLKSLATKTGYQTYFESWNPNSVTEQEMVIEGLKHLFVTQTLDQRIEEALPLLARIQQQGTEMKEANIFESWANQLMEGTWATPDTPEKRAQLVALMSKEFPVGPDATNATEQLYDIMGDDELVDRLETLAINDADADARQIIYDRMQELSNNPDVRSAMAEFTMDQKTPAGKPDSWTPERQAAAQEKGSWKGMDETVKDPYTQTEDPANTKQPKYDEYEDSLADILKRAGVDDTVVSAPDYETGAVIKESRLNDSAGTTLNHIMDRFKHEVKTFEQGGELDRDLYEALFDYWDDAGEIPYGVAKARTGDPYEWVATNLQSHLSGGGIIDGNPDEDMGIERESAGDYAEEKSRMRDLAGLPTEELEEFAPLAAAVGGALARGAVTGAGALTRGAASLAGQVAGNAVGNALSGDEDLAEGSCNMTEAGEMCPTHGLKECGMEESALAGQYGHPGRMTEVSKDIGFLDRLKELSGMTRK